MNVSDFVLFQTTHTCVVFYFYYGLTVFTLLLLFCFDYILLFHLTGWLTQWLKTLRRFWIRFPGRSNLKQCRQRLATVATFL